MTPEQALAAALALLGQDPLPADAAEQLERLEAIAGADYADRFGDLWEAYQAAGGE